MASAEKATSALNAADATDARNPAGATGATHTVNSAAAAATATAANTSSRVGSVLRHVWYGDDFTGASDTLATLAAAGLRARLFLSVPTAAQLERTGPMDALGIAGTARALPREAMLAELAPVAQFFAALRPPVTHYKCCSTFDSAPQVGNLAEGLRAFRSGVHDPFVPILGGQPSLGRYCAFGELYASASAGGEVHRVDRHPTMSVHPVTPMHEADLRRHLAAQGLAHVALIDIRSLDEHDGSDDATLDAVLEAHLATEPDAVLLDTTRAAHLRRIGRLIWRRASRRPLLALGASSVAQALIAHWQTLGLTPGRPVQVAAAEGPVFLLVGSLSPVTASQVVAGGGRYEHIALDAQALVASEAALDTLAERCAALLRTGRPVLARAASPHADGPTPTALALACGRLLTRVLGRAPHVRRIGVAGGDTSSFALRELGPWALDWAGSLAPGVPLMRVLADDPALDGLELMLKGGQMGPPDVFERLLRGAG